MHVSTDEIAQQPPSDQVTEQLHRILQSDTFKSSGILRQLLDYLTDHHKLLERKDLDVVLIATPDHWHTALPSMH